MAEWVEAGRVQANHRSLHHLIAKADWSDAAVTVVVRSRVLPTIEQHRPSLAWIIDDTDLPKKGTHSVGVARQYRGLLGKQDNCQIAVSVMVANEHASAAGLRALSATRWAKDAVRRGKASVPDDLRFATKPQIALTHIRKAQADGIPPGIVLAAAGHDVDTNFRGTNHRTWSGLCLVWPMSSASSPPPAAKPGAAGPCRA